MTSFGTIDFNDSRSEKMNDGFVYVDVVPDGRPVEVTQSTGLTKK